MLTRLDGMFVSVPLAASLNSNISRRWCFFLQVPVSAIALFLGWLVIHNPTSPNVSWQDIRTRVDFTGAVLLVSAISIQLVGLSLGGNELSWSSGWVLGSLASSLIILAAFVWVEATTTAIPIIPLRQLRGRNPIAVQTANLCAGAAAYAYLFTLPLFFQVVLLDSATKAGTRLAIPSLATPVGGVIAGVIMSRWGKLLSLVRIGAVLMTLGNGLVASFGFYDSTWKYIVFIFPANLGQGIIYPAMLFTTLASFDHSGKCIDECRICKTSKLF